MSIFQSVRFVVCLWCLAVAGSLDAEQWSIPLAGNAFRTAPNVGGKSLRDSQLTWSAADEVYSIFFHVDRAAKLDLSLVCESSEHESSIVVRGPQQQVFNLVLSPNSQLPARLGEIKSEGPTYVRLDIQGLQRSGKSFAAIKELVVASDTVGLAVDFVRDNQGQMFYWGRRGPSVHLSYKVPDIDLQYAYSELTVPDGLDPIGSYFMANGFAQGYFGMQVNGVDERRILFSVWSPFQTDDPQKIPEDQRVLLVSKGPNTRTGEFGNEGSGGQSYLNFPWKSGEIYRFLTEVRPGSEGSTIYTCWFAPKSADWQLVASFRRPKTTTYLRGFHSFLESFDPSRGHLERRCSYGNVWVADTTGNWHACNQAKFSVDPTGKDRHRLDFQGGTDGNQFWLRNCGFFSGDVKAGAMFTRKAADQPPQIKFAELPR